MGPVDGGRDEGVGSNWSGCCYCPLELPSDVADMEGMGRWELWGGGSYGEVGADLSTSKLGSKLCDLEQRSEICLLYF